MGPKWNSLDNIDDIFKALKKKLLSSWPWYKVS